MRSSKIEATAGGVRYQGSRLKDKCAKVFLEARRGRGEDIIRVVTEWL